jgi:fatty acid/phospholipid biosynthesis enzyme
MRTKSYWIMPSVIHARRLPMHSWEKQRVPDRKFDALGNDVTETVDVEEARAVVTRHEEMLADLGLSADATREEIEAARQKRAEEIEYENAKEYIAEYEANKSALDEEDPKPEPPTALETREYEDAKAIVAAHEAKANAPVEEPKAEQTARY